MSSVRYVSCKNRGAFDMKFKVVAAGVNSSTTPYYPVDQTYTIDLNTMNIQSGVEVWPVIDVKDGDHNVACGIKVVYDPAGGTALYEVTGTTKNVQCGLQST